MAYRSEHILGTRIGKFSTFRGEGRELPMRKVEIDWVFKRGVVREAIEVRAGQAFAPTPCQVPFPTVLLSLDVRQYESEGHADSHVPRC